MRRILLTIFVVMVGGVPQSLRAQAERGAYAGVSFGQAKFVAPTPSVPPPFFSTSDTRRKTTDTASKLFAGYRVNRNFALEGGYTDFGRFSATQDVSRIVSTSFGVPRLFSLPGTTEAQIRSSGFHLDLLGSVGDRLSLFGKLGLAYTTTKTNFRTTEGPGEPPGNIDPREVRPATVVSTSSARRSELNPKFGFGLEYPVFRGMAARIEYEEILRVGDSRTGESDMSLVTIGLIYRF